MKHWPEKQYFQAIIDGMKEGGFEFLSWVTMNSKKYESRPKYYGESQYSRMFFNAAENKSLIVMFEYVHHEGCYEGNPEVLNADYLFSYWHIEVWYNYSQKRHIEDWYLKHHEDYPGFSIIGYFANPRWDQDNNDPSFKFRFTGSAGLNCSFEQIDSHIQLTPEDLFTPAVKLLKYIKPWLYVKFRDLQVTSFPPFSFSEAPESVPEFWGRFDLKRLAKIAQNYWGSEFK
jgi:hypothetical protein